MMRITLSDRKRNLIEKQNQRIINENTTRVELVRTALNTVFGDAIDEDGNKVNFIFNIFAIGEDSFTESKGIGKYQSYAVRYGILAETPNITPIMQDYGKALAV